MKVRSSSFTRFVVCIMMLCNMFTVPMAWAAEIWSVSNPTDGSARAQTANVDGAGMTSEADGAQATFQFRKPNTSVPGGWVIEREVTVTANMMSWNGNLEPPPGGWTVSPKDEMGMYIGDHRAVITWDDPPKLYWTPNHIVTE